MQTEDTRTNISTRPVFKQVLDITCMEKIPSHIYLIAKELECFMKVNGIQELAGIKLRSYIKNPHRKAESHD
jgi:hypothetical protein